MPGSTTSTGHVPPRDEALATLADLLSSRNRAILLAWATPRLDTPFSLTELSRAVHLPVSSVQHECYKLERLGVLEARREGNSRRYRMMLDHPLTRPLIALVIATLGLQTVLHDAVVETGEVTAAVVAGPSPWSGSDRLTLAIVGHLPLEGLVQAQHRVALVLARMPDDLDLAYVQDADWTVDHELITTLAGRPLQAVLGTWPPARTARPGDDSPT
jgi:DNA-binding transcriptional ArsR family regulator